MSHRHVPRAFAVLALTTGVALVPGITTANAAAPKHAAPTTSTSLSIPLVNIVTGKALANVSVSTAVRDIDATISMTSSPVTLPRGKYDLRACLTATPADPSGPQCSAATVTSTGKGVPAPSVSLSLYRPLDVLTTVAATLSVNQYDAVGDLVEYALTRPKNGINSVTVPNAATAHAQSRGANVGLFQPGATLDDMAKDLDALHSAGATMVRTSFPWPLLQPTDTPTFDPDVVAKIDGFLQLAEDRGIGVLATFGSTPCWASSAPASIKGDCSQLIGWGKYPPSSLDSYGKAATLFAQTFGSRLAGVEIWNEPNNPQFFAGTASDYANILKQAYTSMKAVAPQLTVVGGSLAYADTTWLSQLYAAGAHGSFDALSVHPYQVRNGSETSDPLTQWQPADPVHTFGTGVVAMHDLMAAKGDSGKPIWITEFGYGDCTLASPLCVTDEQQGTYLASSLRMAARLPYVPVVLSYNTRDTKTDGLWQDTLGLLRHDFTPKPAYDAVTATLSCLSAFTC